MGCRTRVIGNAHDPSREIETGRGNLSFTSINMPRLAINAKGNVGAFFDSLDEMMDLCIAQPMAELARRLHDYQGSKLNVIAYTGFTYEYLIEHADSENGFMKLLKETDYLIDGRFVLAERSLELKFRGSRNQRFIDVQRSLKEGKAVVLDDEALSLM